MSYGARQARAIMDSQTHIEVRQEASTAQSPSKIASSTLGATTKSASLLPQPTTVIALTTTFTPPASCMENRLSMLPPPGYFIWANEPVPADNVTSSACYPSEFLKAYTSVASGVGSSIVPAMKPLVCPDNYCTMFAADNNYLACCPSGYQFHPPDTTVDPKRPGYGGNCYSDFPVNSAVTVTQFDADGGVVSVQWSATASGQQAFAHPIDGFAADGEKLIVGCQTPVPLASAFSSQQSQSQSVSAPNAHGAAPSPTSTPPPRSTPSKGTIAGASIGAVGALAAIIFLVWFILRCVRQRRKAATRPNIHHIDHAQSKVEATSQAVEKDDGALSEMGFGKKDDSVIVVEMATEKSKKYPSRNSQMNNGQGAFEVYGDTVPELDGGDAVKKGKGWSKKIGFAT